MGCFSFGGMSCSAVCVLIGGVSCLVGCVVWCGVCVLRDVFCFALCVLFGGMFSVQLSCLFVCADVWLSFCLAVFLFCCTDVSVWL